MSAARAQLEPIPPSDASRFERVREEVGLYAEVGPEPVPPGAERWIARRGERATARCTLLTARDVHGAAGLTGMIGHYEALEAVDGVALLTHAREQLAARGVARVLGPLNGSTWARYRLALAGEPGDPAFDPPHFLTEPRNPFEYAEQFAAAGFGIAARYESRIDETPAAAAADAAELAERIGGQGIRIRPLDLGRFDLELRTLFDLSLAAFAENPYYSPIGFDAFRASYEKMRPIIDPGLVLIAEDAHGTPVAFVFGFVDPTSRSGGKPPRAIIKTIATSPAARGRGLAHHLMDRVRRGAHERGCTATIHALMHVANFSMKMSARHRTRRFRRYALYQWTP